MKPTRRISKPQRPSPLAAQNDDSDGQQNKKPRRDGGYIHGSRKSSAPAASEDQQRRRKSSTSFDSPSKQPQHMAAKDEEGHDDESDEQRIRDTTQENLVANRDEPSELPTPPEGEEDDYYAKSNEIPPQLMEKLSKFPLFNNAPPAFHKAVAGRLKLMTHHAQEYIVKFGEPAKAMYWILRGSVAVTSPDGEAVHAELVSGQFFGEIGILFNRPRTATVIARTKVLLGVLTADSFNAVLPDFPAVERTIRDEAQERLSMQDKRKRNGIANIINSTTGQVLLNKHDLDTSASAVATAASTLPGPSVPPILRASSPTVPLSHFRQDILTSLPSVILDAHIQNDEQQRRLPHIHDNVDHSIPTRDFLRSLPMFTLLSSNIIHELVLGVEPKRFEPFEYIVRKGELGRDIYFIVNGEVEVLGQKRFSLDTSVAEKDSKVDDVLGRLSPGQYFGEMAFLQSLTDSKEKIERSADIRTVSTVDVLIVTGDQLESLYSRYPQICDEMRETATKRINRNMDHDEGEKELQDSPFGRWKGFQSGATGLTAPIPMLPRTTTSTSLYDPLSLAPTAPVPDFARSTSPFSAGGDTDHGSTSMFSGFNSFKSSIATTVKDQSTDPKSIFNRKRSISQISLGQSSRPTQTTQQQSQQPLVLTVPPLNPSVPNLNVFESQRRPSQPFQYMNHAKRLRLHSISAGRRRSSVLSTGVLPDRVLLRVFALLELPELMKLRQICRRWRQLLYVAPGFFEYLDLKPYNTSIDDKALIQITDFVGSRPKIIDISNCFHVTDVGLCYMVNEIGMSGSIEAIKMSSVWEVSAMAIMDIAVPSVGHHIVELDLSNCRKVRDNVIERIIGWNNRQHSTVHAMESWDNPVPGMEELDIPDAFVGCLNLKRLNLGYCKHLTDRSMYHIALHANDRLESLDITRCTTITDAGFAYWAYQPFSNLRKLKMSDCTFLTDKSIVAVASSAQNLEALDLSFCCALTDVSIEVLCLGCPNLKYLDLSFCGSAISDSTLLAISIHLRHLSSLIIKGCVRVTRAGVDALLSNSASLRFLDISQCRNAHFYRDSSPAVAITPTHRSRSAFVTTAHGSVVEIVI